MKDSIKDVKLSVLDLAPVLEGFTPADTFKNSLETAQYVEQLGYHRYWFAEHHNMEGVASSATAILISHIAQGTSTIRVGSGGIMLPNHAPLIVAEQFGTLATLFPDRIDLGLGRAPGTDQLTAMALRRDQRDAVEFPKNIQELQTYLSAGNRHGKVRAIPGEGLDIPIWILGSSTESAHLAAALGLPYAFASHFAPAQLYAALSIYHQNFRPSSQLKEPYTMACVNVVAADSDQEAEKLATSFKNMFLGVITGKREKLQAPVDPDDFILDPIEEAALDQMIRYTFTGSPATIRPELDSFIESTQVDELMTVSYIYDQQAKLHSFKLLNELKML